MSIVIGMGGVVTLREAGIQLLNRDSSSLSYLSSSHLSSFSRVSYFFCDVTVAGVITVENLEFAFFKVGLLSGSRCIVRECIS